MVSASQVSGRVARSRRVARVDELILGFWVLNGVWSFSAMAPRRQSMNITSDSCLMGNTTSGFRRVWSATGWSSIVDVQHLKEMVSLPHSYNFGLLPLTVIKIGRASCRE